MARFDRYVLVAACLSTASCSVEPPEPSGSSSTVSSLSSPLTTSGGLSDPTVTSKLRDVSLAVAARAGVSSPATMRAVAASDHQKAETVISGSIVEGHEPVYVVQMTGGSFNALHRPSAAPETPHGDYLTITFDQATLGILDIGYDMVAPSLTKIDPTVVNMM